MRKSSLLAVVAAALIFASRPTRSDTPFDTQSIFQSLAPTPTIVLLLLDIMEAKYEVNEFGQVESLTVERVKLADDNLELLSELHALQSLRFESSHLHPDPKQRPPEPDLPTDASLAHLRHLRQLRELDLKYCHKITGSGLKHLAGLPSLQSLNLAGSGLDEASFHHVSKLRHLRHLRLSMWQVPQERLNDLTSLPLERLDWPCIKREHFPPLGELHQLESWNNDWDDPRLSDLPHLDRLTRIKHLRVELDAAATPEAIAALGKFAGLEALELHGDKDSPWQPVLQQLAKLPKLQGLRLRGLNDDSLAQLPQLPHIETLDLSLSSVSDRGLVCLDKLPALRRLALWPYGLTGAAIEKIASVNEIEVLSLDGTSLESNGLGWLQRFKVKNPGKILFDDSTIKPLGRMPNLRTLRLNLLPLGDEALMHLAASESLESLGVAGTNITDAGFLQLRRLPRLRSVEIEQTQVSYEAAFELYKLKNCSISTGDELAYTLIDRQHSR